MIKLMNLSMPLHFTEYQLHQRIAERLHITEKDILHIQYLKKSIDARKKPHISVVFTLVLHLKHENAVLKRMAKDKDVQPYTPYCYQIPPCTASKERPVVVGFGPAGMFAALLLAKAGLRPLVLERGSCVEERQRDVALFRQTGQLCPDSNVQFGEGGAGTFSDGKLTTGIKDPRIRYVLETFVACGAPEEILYLAKPHIGTDKLVDVVRQMRKTIQQYGGEIHFHACLKKLLQKDGKLTAVTYQKDEQTYEADTSHCILAVGHSARDVFSMLYESGITLTQKNFAVGVRIEHPQTLIDHAMYGRKASPPDLPAADYKLSIHSLNGHSLYTFCMCPGGEVVAASSEPNRLVVNGMSNFSRNGKNANSALLVGVTATELQSSHPLAGIQFQKKLEKSAFQAGGENYFAPVCCVGDFLHGQTPKTLGAVEPTYRPGVTLVSPEAYLPRFLVETLKSGINAMNRKIDGFALPDAVITGVESRSSSPVRIVRNESCESVSMHGLYPCGEGAGYAGGITSAAVDGMRCAEQVIHALSSKRK